jgi:hypothetical protein
MSQQINLFNPIFRKRRFSYTSATAMLYGVGIALALSALGAAYEDYRLRAVRTQAQAVDQAYKEAAANHDKLAAELARQKPDAQLEVELAQSDAQLKSRREIIETLKSGAVGNTGGFSEYMRAFSRQSVSGLWLTGFDIAGNELALQGRALSADLVAGYLRQLNREPALQGRQFAALRISQPPEPAAQPRADREAKARKEAKDQKPMLPRYLEFSISTREPADNPQQAAQTVPARPSLLGAIETAAAPGAAKTAARQEGAR